MNINCTITNIVFENTENGYAVLSAKNNETNKSFTLVFNSGMISPKVGFNLEVSGDWVNNKRFGEQFVATQYKEINPTTEDGIIAYFSCGIFKGIGEKFARKIVNVFGEDTMKVIDETPDRLYEVKGLGDKKIQSIISGWEDHKHIQEIVMFFNQYGLTTSLIMRIYKKFGTDAITAVSNNPYCITDIDGIGFRRADDVALKMGIDKHDPNRRRYCIDYVLAQAGESGHTFLYKGDLIKKSVELLDIDSSEVYDTIDELLEEDELQTLHGQEIFSNMMFYCEKNVGSKLTTLRNVKPYIQTTLPLTIEEIEDEIGIKYNEKQREAFKVVQETNLMVLTGGPGTGKTTTLLGLIKFLRSLGLTIACAAPTGRAAKRMSEVTGMPAKTIHRLLEYNPTSGYQKNEDNPLFYNVIILDEISMVNIQLMNSFLKAVMPSTKLILVGDENQLPCIGPGNILHDIIESNEVPVITLTEIFRQAKGSRIITNAHNIINEKPVVINNKEPNTDFFFINESDPDKLTSLIVDLVHSRLPKKYGVNPTDIQVLSPRRKDVKCSANELNIALQDVVNQHPMQIKHGSTIFKYGDKVMQIKNNYEKEVFNGDVGFIIGIEPEEKVVYVKYNDDFTVSYDETEMDEIILAYASTIHKSQGSEYPIVIIPMLPSFSIMLKRNLIYTGITRAKKVCIIVGELRSLVRAIKDNTYDKRNTALEEWLHNMNKENTISDDFPEE